MRTDRRFRALISVQAALTALKGNRAVHCKAQEHSAAHLQGFQRGAIKPRVVPFQISLQVAKDKFEQWHAEKWLSPRRVLQKAGAEMCPVLLPFWLFEAAIKVEYAAQIGLHGTDDSKSDEELVWRDTDWKTIPYREYPWTLSAMQVYASYNYRRDLTHVVKTPGMLSRARSLSRDEAETQEADVGKGDAGVSVHPPSMRQAVAWELAFRNIRQSEVADATEKLLKDPQVAGVRDVKLRITTLRRRARIVYLPAYVVDYNFGSRFNAHGERTPERFQAVISGMGEGIVAAERHYDSMRAQLTAAAGVGGATALVSWGVAPLLGLQAPALLSAESAFWSFLIAASAGLAANLAPSLLRSYEEESRLQNEQQLFDKYMAMGMGPHHIGDDEQELIRSNVEWQRWEGADKWHWDACKRQLWADNLWRSHHQRRLQRGRLKEYLSTQQERERWEYEQEATRQQRFGRSHFAQHHFGGDMENVQRDHLGYYNALGLEPGAASLPAIKEAFRQAALMWHPDRQKDSEEQRVNAESRFRKLRSAYEVLRDPEKRRQYDRGERIEA
ncbi:hypothetical protein WJX77_003294 [Trebouxia sp. C0004]